MAKRPKLDDFTLAYLEAALWSSTDDDGEPFDRDYSIDDFAPSALRKALKDTKAFQEENAEDLDEAAEMLLPQHGRIRWYEGRDWSSDEQHGHDFWLTRNGHGAGFWDRGYGPVGDRLTKAAKAYGVVEVYVGDDGLLYIFP